MNIAENRLINAPPNWPIPPLTGATKHSPGQIMRHLHLSMTIVFADICGSTRLFESFGDVGARLMEAKIMATLIQVTENHKGTVIKTIGDKLMCTFPDSGSAIQASCEMQRLISHDPSLSQINACIRIGLHFGRALREKNDVYGDAVNVAARMVDLAKGGQIITTQATVEHLPPVTLSNTRSLGRVKVHGKREEIEICEIIWQEDTSDLTLARKTIENFADPDLHRLVLHYQGNQVEVGPKNTTVSIGRQEKSDLRVNEALVSRNHASIEFRQGKFILADRSTNGTYVHKESGENFFIHLEVFNLSERGVISLGQKAIKDENQALIYYECEYP